MKIRIVVALLAVCSLSACSSLIGSQGGTIGAIQEADDQLAAKNGIPPAIMEKLRGLAGIQDVRKLPASSRVLPLGWTWKQDILDGDGKPVDVSKFHRGPPYIVPDGSTVENTVTAADLFPAGSALPPDAASLLDQILKDIAADPSLLDPAQSPSGIVAGKPAPGE